MINMELISIHHSGFAIKTENYSVIIDYYKDTENVVKEILSDSKAIYVLSSHSHTDHFNHEVLGWNKSFNNITYILSNDIKKKLKKLCDGETLDSIYFLKKGESFLDENLSIMAFGSTDVGISFLLNLQGKQVFHAGDLNNWRWDGESTEKEKKMAESSFLAILRDLKRYVSVLDVAMFPVDARMQGDYSRGARQFVHEFDVKKFIPMHTWGMWNKSCDFDVYKNDAYGEYVCLRDGEKITL